MSSFEIESVSRYTELIPDAQGDGISKSIYMVNYRVRFNKKLLMRRQLTVWATDEIDAYNKARHELGEPNNVIQNR